MGKTLAILLFGVIFSAGGWGQSLYAQALPSLEPIPARPMPRLASVQMHEPLLLLGSQETDYASLVVDPKEIVIVKAYRDSAILASMGPAASSGVYLIKLKNKKTLLKLEDVLDYFQVPQEQRHLRILLNKQPLNRSRFLADVKRIIKIDVMTQDKISLYRLSWDENEQFLNIVTVQEAQL
ncbi:hypothetical protein [Rufibacter hautae]|uniref:Uncharacterized protein n=1 Tax=Rufibacter hautae TaxID=2595005 RepID=A0A5B6TMD6_9BACT|nr:hypothetical protein [Rufibacter hautae]KAA3440660.1 hypothetical protein FOA19_08425 [Rufibacter hautae]